jgi:hypothetical protein
MKALPTATTTGASKGIDSKAGVIIVKAFGTLVRRVALKLNQRCDHPPSPIFHFILYLAHLMKNDSPIDSKEVRMVSQ